jgi:hypothetical protein
MSIYYHDATGLPVPCVKSPFLEMLILEVFGLEAVIRGTQRVFVLDCETQRLYQDKNPPPSIA